MTLTDVVMSDNGVALGKGGAIYNIDLDAELTIINSTLESNSASYAGGAIYNHYGTVTIQNSSAWSIYELYVSPTTDDAWGDDQLGTEVISTGESFDLTRVPCGSYDVKLVDEDSDVCVLNAVDICGKSNTWVIDSESLLACQAGTTTTTTASSGGSITIENQSAWAIWRFYLSPVTDSTCRYSEPKWVASDSATSAGTRSAATWRSSPFQSWMSPPRTGVRAVRHGGDARPCLRQTRSTARCDS